MKHLRTTIISSLLFVMAQPLFANTLEDIQFSELLGGQIQIRATFSEAPVTPKGFVIEKPARIVLDFDAIENNLDQKKFPLSFDNAKSALVLASGEKTRLVLNLVNPSTYTTSVSGNTLIATVDGATQAETFTRQQASEAAQNNFSDKPGLQVTEFDFRRSEDGAGNILVSLSDPKVAVDIEDTGSGILINFANTAIPFELRRRLDVLDFATPVRIIESSQVGASTQVNVDINGQFEYLAYQTDTQYVITVKPLTQRQLEERQEKFQFTGEKLSLKLRTEFIRIRYAKADAIFELFKGQGETGEASSQSTRGILSERGSAIVDERTNSIILTETEDKIAQFKTLIEQLDIPIRQVMIESRIVIASNNFRKELGITLAGDAATRSGGNVFEATGTLDGFVNADGNGPEAVFIDSDGDGVSDDDRNLAASNLVNLGLGETTGSIAFNILTDSLLLGLEITALENSGLAEVVSQPKVITGDKQQATIESGQEIPYQVVTQDGVSIQFREAVLKLDVTPQITPDNRVIMDLIINQDSVSDVEVVSNNFKSAFIR